MTEGWIALETPRRTFLHGVLQIALMWCIFNNRNNQRAFVAMSLVKGVSDIIERSRDSYIDSFDHLLMSDPEFIGIQQCNEHGMHGMSMNACS